MPITQPYQALNDGDTTVEESFRDLEHSSRVSRSLPWSWISKVEVATFSVSLVILALTIFLVIRPEQSQILKNPDVRKYWESCGSSPAEARGKGCRFDIVSFAWKFESCFDEDLSQEFMAENDWEFYEDKEGERKVSIEVVRRGERDMWVSWRFHMVHCTYMWRQMHRALTSGRPIDSHLSAYHHTLHCGEVLLNRNKSMDAINTMAPIIYPVCEMF
jgi:hypothetical protein